MTQPPERLADGGGMTEEELQAIRERAANATPGPWAMHDWVCDSVVPEAQKGNAWGASIDPVEHARFAAHVATVPAENNRAFIAHARADVPKLLAEVVALRSQLAHRTREAVAWETERAGSELAANAYDPMRHRQLSGCAHSITETCDQCHCPTCGQPVVVMTAQHEGAKPFYVPLNAVLVDLRSTPPAPA